jgi:hypothetical protein
MYVHGITSELLKMIAACLPADDVHQKASNYSHSLTSISCMQLIIGAQNTHFTRVRGRCRKHVGHHADHPDHAQINARGASVFYLRSHRHEPSRSRSRGIYFSNRVTQCTLAALDLCRVPRGRKIVYILLDTCTETTLRRRACGGCQARSRVCLTDEKVGTERLQHALSARRFEVYLRQLYDGMQAEGGPQVQPELQRISNNGDEGQVEELVQRIVRTVESLNQPSQSLLNR